MKKLFIFSSFIFSIYLSAQDPTPAKIQDSIPPQVKDTSWKVSGFFGLNFSQTALNNWQGGGQDNITFTSILSFEANYKKGRHEWNNKLDVQYGIVSQGNSKFWKKNIDQILAVSQYNVLAFKKSWFYSTMADFRSQLSPGYNYSGDNWLWAWISDRPIIFQQQFLHWQAELQLLMIKLLQTKGITELQKLF
jgi:hypothetical protein